MLFLCLSLSFSSCSIFRGGNKSDVQAHNEMVKRQNDAIDEEVKKYDKMYHEQTDRQDKQQRKMIKKSRKKPKHMRRHEREFFLWRWLGI
jgi:hypothetical protein